VFKGTRTKMVLADIDKKLYFCKEVTKITN
jgi:hypothetical protein